MWQPATNPAVSGNWGGISLSVVLRVGSLKWFFIWFGWFNQMSLYNFFYNHITFYFCGHEKKWKFKYHKKNIEYINFYSCVFCNINVNILTMLHKSESEILGLSEASFSMFVLCTNNYFFAILSPSYIHNQSYECTKTCIWYVCICM